MPLAPLAEDPGLDDCRGRYIRSAVVHLRQALASSMGTEQFERFQQTPAYHEVLVQKAAQQYWIYETFLHLRAHGERTVHIGPAASMEMLAAPLEDFGSDFGLEVPATMLVFESPTWWKPSTPGSAGRATAAITPRLRCACWRWK